MCEQNSSRDLMERYNKQKGFQPKIKNKQSESTTLEQSESTTLEQSESTTLHSQDGQQNTSNNTDDGSTDTTHIGLIIMLCALAFIVTLSAVIGIVMFKRGQIVWTGFPRAGTDTKQIHTLPSAATLKTQHGSSINSSVRYHLYEDIEDGFHRAGTDTKQIHKLPSAATLKTQNWSSINSSVRYHHYEDVEDGQKYESIDPRRSEHQYRTVWTVDQSTDYNDLGPRTDSHKYKPLRVAPKISPNKP